MATPLMVAGTVLGTMITVAWVAMIGMVLAGIMALALGFDAEKTGSRVDLPPCPTEDSVGCYWDGDTRGNGLGRDIVTMPGTPSN